MTDKKNSLRLPGIACEITAQGVAAVRCVKGQIAAFHSRALEAGVLTPALNAQNIQNAPALVTAIAQALSAVGGHGREIVAVLPDAAIRMTLLDFDSLPDRHAEAEAAIRFRLRKSLPFDVDHAAISFDRQRTAQGLRVAVSVIVRNVLSEYETAFLAAGAAPGVVISSSLAALGAIADDRPTMLMKVGREASTIAATSQGQLRLFRSLEGTGAVDVTAARMADDIFPSLAYFQDNYQEAIETLLLSGVNGSGDLRRALGEQTGMNVAELIGSDVADERQRNEFAGALGALR